MNKMIMIITASLFLQISSLPLSAQSATITCPGDKTVYTDANSCSAIVNNLDPVVSPAGALLNYSISPSGELGVGTVSGKSFPLGLNRITYSLPDYPGVSCSFTIKVEDHTPPVITCPQDITVTCADQIPLANEAYAEDGCTQPGLIRVEFVSDVISNQTCFNRFVVTRTYKATDEFGNSSTCAQRITVFDDQPPHFLQPEPVSPLNVACPADVPAAPANYYIAIDECNPPSEGDEVDVVFKEVKTTGSCPNKYSLTRTWTATDLCGNQKVYTQIINVKDTLGPIFDGPAPSLISVACSSDIPVAPLQTAKDNCSAGPATVSLNEVKSEEVCKNKYKLTRVWTAIDGCGNTTTRTQVIIVNDNVPPTVSNISVDTIVLWPPNHKMKDVAINYTATDNCEVTGTLSVTSSDPVNGGSDGDLSPDWEIVDAHHVRLRAEKANNGQARYYTITIHITDGCNEGKDTTVTVVVAHNITSPQTGHPYRIGSSVSLNGAFWDKPDNTHTAKWLLDGSAATNGTVTEPSGNQNGKVSGSYKFNTAGVYKLQMNVTDQTGITSYANTNNDLDAIVVIYDPNGGYAYGGGWFQSQAGALTSNAAAEGKASYGFSVNYRNAAKPKGETQFEFKVGSFEFNALNFDYLAISGARAQFRGTGKIIGGQSGIGFIMTVKDGAFDGSDIDKIRMKIYNRNTGYVYYDNQAGASDADDPTTVVGANSSIVIQGTEVVTRARDAEQVKEKLVDRPEFIAYPNPGNKYFNVQVKTNDQTTKLQMQVYDQYGRLLEKRDNVVAGSVIRLGEMYRPGIYYVRIIQGDQHSEVKLVKLSD